MGKDKSFPSAQENDLYGGRKKNTLLTAEQTNLQPRTMALRRMVKSPRDSGYLDCSFRTKRVIVIKSVLLVSAWWSIRLPFSLSQCSVWIPAAIYANSTKERYLFLKDDKSIYLYQYLGIKDFYEWRELRHEKVVNEAIGMTHGYDAVITNNSHTILSKKRRKEENGAKGWD